MEGHNRTVSGPNYVTRWSFISRAENTFVLSLYKLPLHLGLDPVWNISSSHLIPARTVIRQTSYQRGCSLLVQFWNNVLMPRKVSQGRLKIALLSVLCLFPLYITSNSPIERRFVILSRGLQFVSRGEKRRGLVVAS